LLIYRVYSLSIKSNTFYEELAKQNMLNKKVLKPVRGVIYDRNNIPLAINNLGFKVSIKPHLRYKSKEKKLNDILKNIVTLLPKYTLKKLHKKYIKNDSPYVHNYIKVIDFIAYDDFIKLYPKFKMLEGIQIDSAFKRQYPYKDIGAHIIGYVGKASRKDYQKSPITRYTNTIGKDGLEKYYNSYLQGKLGHRIIKVNAYGKELAELKVVPPKHNNDIKISLDIKLQTYINKIFDKSGVVIVMDTQTGEIIASGSYPEYDVNLFVNGISNKEWAKIRDDFNHTFTNKIIKGIYPPGSVVKMGVAMSFLDNGISSRDTVDCNGTYQVGGRNFRCWKHDGHGYTSMNRAIRESCDDYFYKFGRKVGISKISDRLSTLGFGKVTGIDLPNEYYGINPNKLWKKRRYNQPWYIGETLIASIGQGYFLVTPMQVARYTAFLASGSLPVPHYRIDDNTTRYIPKEIKYNKSYLKIIQKAMFQVCNHPNGTATNHIHLKHGLKIAGKTGTAQVVGISQSEKKRMKEHELEFFKRSHAWLTTYAPYKNPRYVVTVLVEHGGHGGSAGGVIVSKIYNKMWELGYFKK
jgi:penicillin-binding protein 2